ncbi:Transmembrane protein [Nymphaea thermarum]|nr:Transmembrane protein [Nymphaea thermarum]
MAYVDHAFSISDEDALEPSGAVQNRSPVKEVSLAIALLVFGTLSIAFGLYMASNKIGGDRIHGDLLLLWVVLSNAGIFFAGLGSALFLPGFYYTRIAYYAYKGYKGFSFSNIPPV